MPRTLKKGDTWPPIRMKVEDEDGLIPGATLDAATSITFFAKSGATLITGPMQVIDPPEDGTDPDGPFNLRYPIAAGDTDTVGEYKVEAKIVYTPGSEETFPNTGTETLTIEEDQE